MVIRVMFKFLLGTKTQVADGDMMNGNIENGKI
jgi:hypothetical protein